MAAPLQLPMMAHSTPADASAWQQWDLAKLIEYTACSVLPTALLIAASPFHMVHYQQQPPVAPRSGLLWSKLALINILALIEFARCCLCRISPDIDNESLITSTSLTLIAAFCIGFMSYFEHRHATQPSLILSVYLTVAVFTDGLRTWVYSATPRLHLVAVLSAVTATIKLSLVILQEVPKHLDPKDENAEEFGPEDLAGFWNQALLLWLNSTLLFGFRKVLRSSDLPNLGPEFSSTKLNADFNRLWKKSHKQSSLCLMETSFLAISGPLVLAAIPRLLLSVCAFLLPRVIEQVLLYTRDQTRQPSTLEQGVLIAMVGLVYFGIMISRAYAIHLANRATTFLRGMLISQIAQKNLRLYRSVAKRSAALTLISNDVDGILVGVRNVHEVWVSAVEAGVCLYILSSSVGAAFFCPLLTMCISAFSSWKLGKHLTDATTAWTESIELRVARMATMLKQMKGIKMIGLEPIMTAYIRRLRKEEIEKSENSRKLTVNQITLVPINAVLTPTGVIAAALFWTSFSSGLEVVSTFTTLAYLSLLAEPMHELLRSWPMMGTMISGFKRTQVFLLLEERRDPRETRNFNLVGEEYLSEKYKAPLRPSRCISFLDTSVKSSSTDLDVLKHLQFSVDDGALVLVVGPVASGKSALLKTMLGETRLTRGEIHRQQGSIAFCDQRPWLPNATIREVITGGGPFNAKRYNATIHACALEPDLQYLPRGDQTKTGLDGSALSGGQKQRVALARAVYDEAEVLILDDVLSALDCDTASIVFSRLFSDQGLLKSQDRTVILATHSVEYLEAADQVFALDGKGKLSVDTEAIVRRYRQFIPAHDRPVNADNEADQEAVVVEQLSDDVEQDANQQDGPLTSNMNLYKFFLKTVPPALLVQWVISMAAAASLERAPVVYFRVWLEHDPANKSWIMGLVLLSMMALTANRTAGWLFLMTIMPIIASDMHEIFLQTVMSANLPFITAVSSGVLLNRFSKDMTLVSHDLPLSFQRFIYSCFLSATDTIIIASGTKFGWYIIPIVVPALWTLQWFYLRTSRQLRSLELECRTPLYTALEEAINGLEHIRAFGWEAKTVKKSLTALDISQKPYYYMCCIRRWLVLVLDLKVGIIAVALVTIAVTVRDATTTPYLGMALLATMSYSVSMQDLVWDLTKVEDSLRAVARLENFVENTPVEQDGLEVQEPDERWPQEGHITFTNLGARYSREVGPRMALEDVSLEIQPREHVVVMGRTGSGKSSLLLTALNFLDYTGSVYIDGVDLKTVPRHKIRSVVTTIPQDPVDIPGTVRDNLLPKDMLKEDREKTVHDIAIIEVLKAVELLDYIHERGGINAPIEAMEFSAGQKQLLSLARGMLEHVEYSTKIILLDEPTSSMDYDMEMKMRAIINEAFQNCTRITITHRRVMEVGSDSVLELADGKILSHTYVQRPQVAPATRRTPAALGYTTDPEGLLDLVRSWGNPEYNLEEVAAAIRTQ